MTELHDTLEALLDRISAAVVSADAAGIVTFANRASIEMLGPEAGVGKDLLSLFGGSSALQEVLATAGPDERRISLSLLRRDGRRLELGLAVVAGGQGSLAHVILFRDLGDQRRLETEMRRIERLASVGRLAGGFAHEIRNPLAAMQGLVELTLAETPVEDPRSEYARRTLVLVKRMERLVRGALDFAEPAPTAPRKCDLGALARSVIDALAPHWGRRGAGPTLTIGTARRAWADPDQVGECLRALIENGIDAVEDAAALEILVGDDDSGDGVVIRVHDTGGGIGEGDLERIFDPFFTTKPKGTGLGLAVAQAIAVRNEGSLSVRSRPGETVFSLRLPAAPEQGQRR